MQIVLFEWDDRPPTITTELPTSITGCSSWFGYSNAAKISLYFRPLNSLTFISSPFLASTLTIAKRLERLDSKPCLASIVHSFELFPAAFYSIETEIVDGFTSYDRIHDPLEEIYLFVQKKLNFDNIPDGKLD